MRLLRRSLTAADGPTDLRAEFTAAWDRLEIHSEDIDGTTSGALFATEALLRWRRNTVELWGPDLILPIAEATNTIEPCMCWATELTLTTWASSERRLEGGRLALRIHPSQLVRPHLAAEIATHLVRRELTADELILEIPADIGPDEGRNAVDHLSRLLDAGADIALHDHRGIDDTATTPHWLPDGSLVKLDAALTPAAGDAVGREILQRTADALHDDGFAVVATSVIDPAQFDAVVDCGIEWAQGTRVATPNLLR